MQWASTMPCCWTNWKRRSAGSVGSWPTWAKHESYLHHAAALFMLRLVFYDSPGAGSGSAFGRGHGRANGRAHEAKFGGPVSVRPAHGSAGTHLICGARILYSQLFMAGA